MTLKEIKINLAKIVAQLSEIQTDKAVLTWNTSEALKVGDEVFVANENGDYVSAPDGEYTSEEFIYVVADGKIAEIKEVVKAEEVPSPDGMEEPVPDAVEELRKEVNELYKIVDQLVEKYSEIEEKIKSTDQVVEKLSKTPAAKPAEEVTYKSFKEIVDNAKQMFNE